MLTALLVTIGGVLVCLTSTVAARQTRQALRYVALHKEA